MEHENTGEGGTQIDYVKPGILDNDDHIIHNIGGLGYNSNVGLSQFKRRGLGQYYDNITYDPDDQKYEFMGSIKKQKLQPAPVLTKEDAEKVLESEGVKGSSREMTNTTTEADAGMDQQLAFTNGEIKKEANRQEQPVEADKEGQSY